MFAPGVVVGGVEVDRLPPAELLAITRALTLQPAVHEPDDARRAGQPDRARVVAGEKIGTTVTRNA